MPGFAGSDLTKWIGHIMTKPLAGRSGVGRRLLSVAVGLAAVAGSAEFGGTSGSVGAQSEQTRHDLLPAFEVASVKPNRSAGNYTYILFHPGGRFTTENMLLSSIIEFAYGVRADQISGGPSWINSERFDIDARDDEGAAKVNGLTSDQVWERRRLLVQSLLADRFNLRVSRKTKELPIYALVIGKNGPRFSPTTVTSPDRADINSPNSRRILKSWGKVSMTAMPIRSLAEALSEQLGRQVVDGTGLEGNYDLKLEWTPENQTATLGGVGDASHDAANPLSVPDSTGVSIFAAIQEQLGLKLERRKGPVEILVIDHVERPSEN